MKIRYYGHVGQGTGYARAADGMCMALLRAGAELEISTPAFQDPNLEACLPLASCLRAEDDLSSDPDVVIVHTLPNSCPAVFGAAVSRIASEPKWVAYTTWEGFGLAPKTLTDPIAEVFDDIWHPSSASASGFGGDELPDDPTMAIIPHAFDEDSLAARRAPADGVEHERFRFYYVGAWNQRKNVPGLLRAYAHAFRQGERDVELLIHCAGVDASRFEQGLAGTGVHPDDMPAVRFSNARVSEAAMYHLHRAADCFVTASRGEAWNLPAFEAVLANRRVIAPAAQGHMAFLQRTNADIYGTHPMPALIDIQVRAGASAGSLEVVSSGAQGLTAQSLWLEPDLFDLSCTMRDVFDCRHRGITVNYDLSERFGYCAVGKLAMRRLEHLLAKGT